LPHPSASHHMSGCIGARKRSFARLWADRCPRFGMRL
jgi:hypothetical protein